MFDRSPELTHGMAREVRAAGLPPIAVDHNGVGGWGTPWQSSHTTGRPASHTENHRAHSFKLTGHRHTALKYLKPQSASRTRLKVEARALKTRRELYDTSRVCIQPPWTVV
eukprot:377347-Prymnesium_polylepis.1